MIRQPPGRFVVDCSVALKWRSPAELHYAEAMELFLDWQQAVVELIAPTILKAEFLSASLRGCRRGRISMVEALDTIRYLLALPIFYYDITLPWIERAFEIAYNYGQGSHDCLYVALAEREGVEFWTGDQRLFNALHSPLPFVRWIGTYRRRRP
jgi:predicted nucleic acid-binding protein